MADTPAAVSASTPVSAPKKKSNLVIIIVIVLVLLCCCGSSVVAVWWGIKNGSIKGDFNIDGLLSPTPTEDATVTSVPTSQPSGTATPAVQSSSDVVRAFFAALDSGDKAAVERLSDPVVFAALYKTYDDGTIAEMFKNNIESLSVIREETVSAGVIVHYDLQVKENADLLEKWNRADVRKLDSSGTQVVQFVGPDE